MPTFAIKQLDVPLFGVVDNPDQAAWLSAFSSPGLMTNVRLDSSALDIIAEDLEFDAEGLAADAERYVEGRYRFKARGMGGTQLGSLGEVLTYLVNRSREIDIVRVLSWQSGNGQVIKGSRFPQPDFIINDGTSLIALEVKTTEAYDFIDLRDMAKKWTHLRPCCSVATCRKQALPQLGFIDGQWVSQQHSLVDQYGAIVPFPVGKGRATAVIAVDGRVNGLRGNPLYKTPPVCRNADRECWSCLPLGCHLSLVTMKNSPGMLSLGGSARDGSSEWFRCYERWTQALLSRDSFAVRQSLQPLTSAVMQWLNTDGILQPEVLRKFWGSYLGDAMRIRGLNIEVSPELGDLANQEARFEWVRAPLATPINREASTEEIDSLIRRRSRVPPRFMVSTRPVQADGIGKSVTVCGDDEWITFYLTSEVWWRHERVQTIEQAFAIAKQLLSFAMERSGWSLATDTIAVSLRKVTVTIEESEILLGWESIPVSTDRWPKAYWNLWAILFHAWPILLAMGDPRIRVRVRPDGRASLRISRTLLNGE